MLKIILEYNLILRKLTFFEVANHLFCYYILIFVVNYIIINLIFISAIPKGTTDQMHMVLHVVADGKSYYYYYYLTIFITLITPNAFFKVTLITQR